MGIFRLLGGGENDIREDGVNAITRFIDQINGPLDAVIIGILVLIALAATIFAVYVGFKLAKAEDEGKRKEAKSQLLWSIIAIIATVAMFILIQTVLNQFNFDAAIRKIDSDPTNLVMNSVTMVVGSIVAAFNAVLKLATAAAMLFAIYIGIRLATAEDESKRKQAKQQLLWTLVAVVGVIVLSVIIDLIVYNVLMGAMGVVTVP